MEQRLKERLTGAAILVALIVLIVPELFHGHLSERAGRAASSNDGPPVRSYTIDLGGTHPAPLQLGAPSASAVPTAPAASAPSAATDSSAEPTSASSASAPTLSRDSPVRASAAPSIHRGSGPVKTPVPIKSVARSPSSAPDKGAADWSVQLGLYARRANAEHMVHVAHVKGFTASLVKPDARGRYRVRVAGLSTRSAALTLAARLRAAGLPAAAVGPR
jgi:DedD protein